MNWSNRAIAEREKVVKMTHQDIQERMEHVEMSEPHTHVVCNKSELLWSLLITALFVLFLFLSDVPDNSFISFLPQKKNTVFLLLYLPRQMVLLLNCGSFFPRNILLEKIHTTWSKKKKKIHTTMQYNHVAICELFLSTSAVHGLYELWSMYTTTTTTTTTSISLTLNVWKLKYLIYQFSQIGETKKHSIFFLKPDWKQLQIFISEIQPVAEGEICFT